MSPKFAVPLGLLATWCESVAGQGDIGWHGAGGLDLAFRSRYEWRGVTRSSGWVAQPDAFLALQKNASFLTAGVWTNVDLSSRAGLSLPQRWFGEGDAWLEAATSLEHWNLGGGWTIYRFRSIAANRGAPIVNTSEVFARVEFEGVPVAPRLAVWHDVDRIKGTYLEGSLRLQVPVWANTFFPGGSLFITALGGYSAGQEQNPTNPAQGFYFANQGLAFVDLSVSTTIGYLTMGPANLAGHIEGHFQFNRDPLTKRADVGPADQNEVLKSWVGVSLSVALPRCRATRRVCGA